MVIRRRPPTGEAGKIVIENGKLKAEDGATKLQRCRFVVKLLDSGIVNRL